jgi:ammonia channel protein AmtB
MVSAALVLFMTVGLAFFYGGLEPRLTGSPTA